MRVDWANGAAHMRAKHGVTVAEAQEVIEDPRAILLYPDPRSRSGGSGRVLGHSPTAGAVLVIIVVPKEDDSDEWWGASGWPANPSEARLYWETDDDEDQ